MKKIITATTFVLMLILLACSTPGVDTKKVNVYHCPMKCEGEMTYDQAGTCPVCKMDLVQVADNSETDVAGASTVKIVGEMRRVMHKGELAGTISLDTISNKTHLYGLGPIEFLTGEIMILDGKAYVSTVVSDTSMKVEEMFSVKAPFFVYSNVNEWQEIDLPDSVQTLSQLESFLDGATQDHARPFTFKLTATIETGNVHIVNLPKGSQVHSPEEAHRGQVTYPVTNEPCDMVGFFSREHQGIFTHHDSYVHVHLLTQDKKKMGHVDEMTLVKGSAKLYISK